MIKVNPKRYSPTLSHSHLQTKPYSENPLELFMYPLIINILAKKIFDSIKVGLQEITGLNRTYHAHHFIFSFTFYFFVYSVW